MKILQHLPARDNSHSEERFSVLYTFRGSTHEDRFSELYTFKSATYEEHAVQGQNIHIKIRVAWLRCEFFLSIQVKFKKKKKIITNNYNKLPETT